MNNKNKSLFVGVETVRAEIQGIRSNQGTECFHERSVSEGNCGTRKG